MLHNSELPIPAAPEVTDGGPRRLAALLRAVGVTITRHYPSMLPWVLATVAVSAVRCLRDNQQPVALIGIGLPGAGKTEPLGFLTPADDEDDLAQYFYRTDSFTPAAFVSHQASKTKEALDEIDLLPRIKDRTLLTPELAPMFRSRGNEAAPARRDPGLGVGREGLCQRLGCARPSRPPRRLQLRLARR